jgi:predicted DNA-binding transcriptional regulator AlpA
MNTAVAPLLKKVEVAARLAVTLSGLDKLRAKGEAPPEVLVGRSPRWRPEDVEAWIEAQRRVRQAG